MRTTHIPLVLCILIFMFAIKPSKADVDVVTTIAPIHSLASALMQGVGAPHLIIKGAGNPHSYNLRPSDASALSKAKLVFWVGPHMESFLEKSIKTLSPNANIIALSDLSNILLLPNRVEEDEHDHDEDEKDMHVWLSPKNAIVIGLAIKDALASADPINAEIYSNNFKVLIGALKKLDAELFTLLVPVQSSPYLTFHDSFQYFENHYQLTHTGTINLNPNAQIGAKKLAKLRQEISNNPPACIFTEPQYSDRIVKTLNEGINIPTAMIDPLGSQFTPGAELYFQLIRSSALTFKECLSKQ